MPINWQDLIGGSIADGVAKIIGLFKIDPTIALSKQVELQELQLNIAAQLQNKLQDAVEAQLEVNKIEAGSPDWFAANWRPAIGWTCGLGLFTQFIVNPIATWTATLLKHPIQFPSLDLGTLLTLLFGMLGLGAMHMNENIKTAGTNGNGK